LSRPESPKARSPWDREFPHARSASFEASCEGARSRRERCVLSACPPKGFRPFPVVLKSCLAPRRVHLAQMSYKFSQQRGIKFIQRPACIESGRARMAASSETPRHLIHPENRVFAAQASFHSTLLFLQRAGDIDPVDRP